MARVVASAAKRKLHRCDGALKTLDEFEETAAAQPAAAAEWRSVLLKHAEADVHEARRALLGLLDATDGGEAVHRARGAWHEAAAAVAFVNSKPELGAYRRAADHELLEATLALDALQPSRDALKLWRRALAERSGRLAALVDIGTPPADAAALRAAVAAVRTAWQEEQPAARTTLKAQQPALADRRDFRGWWHGQHGARKAELRFLRRLRGTSGAGAEAAAAQLPLLVLEQEAAHNRATARARTRALGSGNDRHSAERLSLAELRGELSFLDQLQTPGLGDRLLLDATQLRAEGYEAAVEAAALEERAAALAPAVAAAARARRDWVWAAGAERMAAATTAALAAVGSRGAAEAEREDLRLQAGEALRASAAAEGLRREHAALTVKLAQLRGKLNVLRALDAPHAQRPTAAELAGAARAAQLRRGISVCELVLISRAHEKAEANAAAADGAIAAVSRRVQAARRTALEDANGRIARASRLPPLLTALPGEGPKAARWRPAVGGRDDGFPHSMAPPLDVFLFQADKAAAEGVPAAPPPRRPPQPPAGEPPKMTGRPTDAIRDAVRRGFAPAVRAALQQVLLKGVAPAEALPFLAEWFGAFAAEGTAGGFAADDDADADEAAAAARQRQRQRAAEAAEHAAKEEKRGKELQWAAAAKGARVAQLKALVGRCTELTARLAAEGATAADDDPEDAADLPYGRRRLTHRSDEAPLATLVKVEAVGPKARAPRAPPMAAAAREAMKSVGGSHRAGGVVAAWMAEERQRERLRFTREAVRDLSEQLSWQVALAAPLQLLVRLVDGAAVLGSGAAVNAVLGVDRRGCSARAGWAATFAVSDSLQSEVTVEVWERSAAPLPGKKKKVKVEGEEDEWTVDGWEVVADGTVELGAMFEEGAAAERVVSLRPLKGASGTYSQTVRLEVRAWRPSWKGLETLQPAPAPPPLVEGETVGILGVARRPELDGVSGTVADLPASGEVVVSVDAADVGADAADSDDALTRVTVPAKYVARLPPFSLEGVSLRCLHDLVDAHATLLGPAATTRDLAERVIAPLTAASGLSLAAALRRARARDETYTGASVPCAGRPTLAVAHAAAASLSSLLAALDAHAAAAGLPHESLVLWIDVCSTPLSHDAAPPPGWWSSAALAHGVKAVGSAILVLSPSVPLAMRDGRALFTAVAAIRAGVPLELRMPPAEVSELRADLARNFPAAHAAFAAVDGFHADAHTDAEQAARRRAVLRGTPFAGLSADGDRLARGAGFDAFDACVRDELDRYVATEALEVVRAAEAAAAAAPMTEMDHFLAADTDHDGRVSREEFIAYQRQTALADFLAADTNRDGKVDRQEFAAFQRKQAAAAAAAPAAAAAAPTEWRVRLSVGADATVRATIAPPESLAESSARLEQSLASLLARLGRWVEAAELLRRAVAARRQARGATDAASVEAAALLAEVEGDLGHTDAAAALLLEVLGIHGAQLGANHETTLDSALRLGWVLRERGSAAEAAQIAERLLTYAATLGRRHPVVLGARTLAAALLSEGGGVDAHDEAVVLLLETLHDCRVAVGSAHALTLGALAALGAAQGTVFRHSDAEHHVRQAVDGAAHLYGPHHPRTLALVGELAAELRASGQAPAALRALGDAPARAQALLGADHPTALALRAHVTWVHLALTGEGAADLTALVAKMSAALGPHARVTRRFAAAQAGARADVARMDGGGGGKVRKKKAAAAFAAQIEEAAKHNWGSRWRWGVPKERRV